MIFLKFPRNYGKIFGFHTYNLKKRCELSLSFGKNYVGMNRGCESSVRLVFSVIFVCVHSSHPSPVILFSYLQMFMVKHLFAFAVQLYIVFLLKILL